MPYRVDCTQEDSFMVQSEDESEVIEHVKQHARRNTTWTWVTTRPAG